MTILSMLLLENTNEMIMKLCSNNMLKDEYAQMVEEGTDAKARHAKLCKFVVFGINI